MSTVLQSKPVAADNLAEKLGFQQKLQAVTNKIHATKNIDEIILELSQELCNLFNADRLTIYLLSEDKGSIEIFDAGAEKEDERVKTVVSGVDFSRLSADGKKLLVGKDKTLALVEPSDGLPDRHGSVEDFQGTRGDRRQSASLAGHE